MRNSGFTLVELLAATVLSTLLFITALSVIRSLGRAANSGPDSSHAWTLAARQQLEWDLFNAAVLKQDEHGLILGGYGSLNASTLSATHLPVLVVYSLRTISGRQWLVREQTGLDPLAVDLNSSELICGDVKTFSITGSYSPRTVASETQTDAAEDPTPIIFQRIAGTQRLPDRVRVRIDLQNDPTPLMNTVLYLR